MRAELNEIADRYDSNLRSIQRLMRFDRIVVEAVVELLERLYSDLEGRSNLAQNTVKNHLDAAKNIRTNDSVRVYYDTMLNQCVVLVVSHFGSAIHDALRFGIREALKHGAKFAVGKQEIKAKMNELWATLDVDASRRADELADILIAQHQVSFQDMQSINRAFADYLGVATPQGAVLNDIIIGQATRHCIVHTGSRMSSRGVKQIGGRQGDRLTLSFKSGDVIQYGPSDVEALASATRDYLLELLTSLDATLPPTAA